MSCATYYCNYNSYIRDLSEKVEYLHDVIIISISISLAQKILLLWNSTQQFLLLHYMPIINAPGNLQVKPGNSIVNSPTD